jgi:hypothetical protein
VAFDGDGDLDLVATFDGTSRLAHSMVVNMATIASSS